jgi:hypothetical protein
MQLAWQCSANFKLAEQHCLFYEAVCIKNGTALFSMSMPCTFRETMHGLNIDSILSPPATSPCFSLISGLHIFHLALLTTRIGTLN